MKLSDLILEYVDASKKTDKLTAELEAHPYPLTWETNRNVREHLDTLLAYHQEFSKLHLHPICLQIGKDREKLFNLRRDILAMMQADTLAREEGSKLSHHG